MSITTRFTAIRETQRQTPECGKFVKLFVHGTEVLSLIPHHFHHNVLKEFWPIYSLDLVF